VVVQGVEVDLWDRAQKFIDDIGGTVNGVFEKLKTSPEYNLAIDTATQTASNLKNGVEAFSDMAGQMLMEDISDPDSINWKETAVDLGAAVEAFAQTVTRLGLAVMISGDVFEAMGEFRNGIEEIADTVEKVVIDLKNPNEETLARFRAEKEAILRHLDDLSALMHEHPIISIVVGSSIFVVGVSLLGWPIAVRILGFSARGPVKGSLAAWAQRYFWGAAVARGSWFARFQSIGALGPRIWGVIWQFIGALLTGVGAFSLKETFEGLWGSLPKAAKSIAA